METSTSPAISRLSFQSTASYEADEIIEEIETLDAGGPGVWNNLEPRILNRLLTSLEKRDIVLNKEMKKLADVERKVDAACEALEARERSVDELEKLVGELETMSKATEEFIKKSEGLGQEDGEGPRPSAVGGGGAHGLGVYGGT